MSPVQPYHKFRGSTGLKLEELVEITRALLPHVAPDQRRYRVGRFPDARTIRFYTASRVVDKPLLRSGRRSLYGYRHILQILAVKSLQAQDLPLVKIRSLLGGLDNRELEALLPAGSVAQPAGARSPADRWIIAASRAGQSAGAGSPSQARPDPGEAEPPWDLWKRIEVSPGIELNILAAAFGEEEREALRGALLRELGRLRGWLG